MPNSWIEKLKVFNAGGDVWAIPRKDTVEREMLNKGQRFTYKLPSMEPKVVEAPKPKPMEVAKPVAIKSESKIKYLTEKQQQELDNINKQLKQLSSSGGGGHKFYLKETALYTKRKVILEKGNPIR
jgi:hypothetical protein